MKILIYLVLLLTFPIGLLLATLCKDELKSWNLKFKIILIASLILSIIVLLLNFDYKMPSVISLFFIVFTMIVLISKSK